ncbi:MAG: lysophospholipid acyltransferase family protein [Bacteroidota bacterium]|nr:lysophospholipid acyltransferase family protein [Bacteroidota bacterium]
MYYLIFGIVYLVSLLPWWILHRISDLAYILIYHVIGYRKEVVIDNITRSFPEKSREEILSITRKFYARFCDNWIETLKLISVSKTGLQKRITGNREVLYQLYETGHSLQVNSGHLFNWEILNISMGFDQPFTFIGIYFPQKSKIADRLMKYIRGRWGNVLIPSTDMARSIIPWRKKQYLIGIIGDQSSREPDSTYWLNFMNRPSCFVKGPEKFARGQKIPVVMVTTSQPKRGHYRFDFTLLASDVNALSEGELMRRYVRHLESNIRQQPELYLWSHRRWKHPWQTSYRSLWIDDTPCPA